jgi:hypothetical protein
MKKFEKKTSKAFKKLSQPKNAAVAAGEQAESSSDSSFETESLKISAKLTSQESIKSKPYAELSQRSHELTETLSKGMSSMKNTAVDKKGSFLKMKDGEKSP